MKGHLIIPIEYKGKKLEFKGKLQKGRYGYKIKINVDGLEVVLAQDEEGRLKLRVRPESLVRDGKVEVELVEVIKRVVEGVVNEI